MIEIDDNEIDFVNIFVTTKVYFYIHIIKYELLRRIMINNIK